MSTLSTKINIQFAVNGSKAVILREGPSKITRCLLWDTKNDELLPGQWIKSKIPNFSINSDASLMLAFVQSYRRRQDYGTWVALSKPPWFSALATWEIGDSWGGACDFISDLEIYVSPGIHEPKFNGKLKKNMRWTNDRNRLNTHQYDWKESGVNEISKCSNISGLRVTKKTEFPDSDILISTEGQELFIKGVYRVDFDIQGRVVFTKRDGIIRRASNNKGDIVTEDVFDLSGMEFESIEAPIDATRW